MSRRPIVLVVIAPLFCPWTDGTLGIRWWRPRRYSVHARITWGEVSTGRGQQLAPHKRRDKDRDIKFGEAN